MADLSLTEILESLEEACRTYEPSPTKSRLETEDLQKLLVEQITDSRIHSLVGRLTNRDFTLQEKGRITRTLGRLKRLYGLKAEGKLGQLLEAVTNFHRPSRKVLTAGG